MGRGQTAAIRPTGAGARDRAGNIEPGLQQVTRDTVRQSLNSLVADAEASGDYTMSEIRDAAERVTRDTADRINRNQTVTLRAIDRRFRENLG